jgi:hypothetical protein
MVQSFGQVPPWGILPSQPALLFRLIGEAVKAGSWGKRFPDEGGKRAICRLKTQQFQIQKMVK